MTDRQTPWLDGQVATDRRTWQYQIDSLTHETSCSRSELGALFALVRYTEADPEALAVVIVDLWLCARSAYPLTEYAELVYLLVAGAPWAGPEGREQAP